MLETVVQPALTSHHELSGNMRGVLMSSFRRGSFQLRHANTEKKTKVESDTSGMLAVASNISFTASSFLMLGVSCTAPSVAKNGGAGLHTDIGISKLQDVGDSGESHKLLQSSSVHPESNCAALHNSRDSQNVPPNPQQTGTELPTFTLPSQEPKPHEFNASRSNTHRLFVTLRPW